MTSDPMIQRLSAALDMTIRSSELIQQYYAISVPVQRKADDSPVTIADRDAELLLRREIETAFPDDSIVGEEHDDRVGTSPYRWILDPIDGTKSFIAGVPMFGTMIGIQQHGESVVGVIDFPGLDRRIYAAKGYGAWQQIGHEEPVVARVNDCDQLGDGVYLTTESASFDARNAGDAHRELTRRSWYARTWGDCYGYYLVATGRAVAMVDPIMNVWDAAALLPILTEAGGTFTDWSGNPTIDGGEGIGTNGRVLEQVLEVTRPYCQPK